MGRPRTPTKVLDARGAFKKNPQRKRGKEPVSEGPLGPPPEHLEPEEVKAWNEIVMTAPDGVLCPADRVEVEFAARMLADARANFAVISITALRHLHTVLGKFGMNPSDRAKLSIEKPKDENPFGSLS